MKIRSVIHTHTKVQKEVEEKPTRLQNIPKFIKKWGRVVLVHTAIGSNVKRL